ncbi:MAG TPA: folylpolyglutamate synthase/dihydrofolate synthase family protein [Gemmatimonadaceae bacterium]|nr:folylpolyglutamate synthase/dihydrofolate synthase family protein [Gemmatimonadaceae bacterium]
MDYFLTPYGEAIKALFARTTSATKPGLERTLALLSMMGSPHLALRAIHVAGTNGKGSVVATADALLRARGLRVGRYTSPHLIDFRERITLNGSPITEERVLAFLEQWTPAAEKLGATFFELTTALAFSWFVEESVDIAVVETGLGGRLDSTNVVLPEVAVVTSIAEDHTELLGVTLEEIAREKAGIFKVATPAVIGEPTSELRGVLATAARAAGAGPITLIDSTYGIRETVVSRVGTTFTLSRGGEEASVTTPLVGLHQARNTTIALAAVEARGEGHTGPLASVSSALAQVFLPGRFQRHGRFILDVAHNPDGARTVAATLEAVDAERPRTAVIAVLSDKDWRGIIRVLSPVVDRFVITNAPSAPPNRMWDAAAAHAFARAAGFSSELEPDFDSALNRAQQDDGTTLVTGSFHTVGDAMSRLQVSPFAA